MFLLVSLLLLVIVLIISVFYIYKSENQDQGTETINSIISTIQNQPKWKYEVPQTTKEYKENGEILENTEIVTYSGTITISNDDIIFHFTSTSNSGSSSYTFTYKYKKNYLEGGLDLYFNPNKKEGTLKKVPSESKLIMTPNLELFPNRNPIIYHI
jgi:uncharacterized protein (UPF0333 family)